MDSLATDLVAPESDGESDVSSVMDTEEWIDPVPHVSTKELEEQARIAQVNPCYAY